jgi:acyl dehydratase
VPLSSASVGAAAEPRETEIDARWTMAYAAGLGDAAPCYLDTLRAGGVVAHPLFPVCFEWPAFLATHGLPVGLTVDERRRGVHATHALAVRRLVRPGDRLRTTATVAGVERRRPGAYQVVRLDTCDAGGGPVCTTWYGSLYRGVEVDGPDRPCADAPAAPARPPAGAPRGEWRVPLAATAAHVYTECARIWNPIHTDAAIARRAGLPGLILHGTATLALALSRLVEAECGGDPARVAAVSARFGAMVRLPGELAVRSLAREPAAGGGARVHFEVLDAGGEPALREGVLECRGGG